MLCYMAAVRRRADDEAQLVSIAVVRNIRGVSEIHRPAQDRPEAARSEPHLQGRTVTRP